jgi:hypothetical protein
VTEKIDSDSFVQTVTGDISEKFPGTENLEIKYLWKDYQCKLSPEMEFFNPKSHYSVLLEDSGLHNRSRKNGAK